MIGAIAGDIIRSVYEYIPMKRTDFPLFKKNSSYTDDSILTIATADAILNGTDYARSYKAFGRDYPGAGYGQFFHEWLLSEGFEPYNSWGNGSAIRVSPIGFAFDTRHEVLEEAGQSSAATHNHPEGIKGAQATALAIFLARSGCSKQEIREEIEDRFEGYNLSRTVDDIRSSYQFEISALRTVPEALIAFLDSTDYEDAIRKAISLGGDSDTQACITGGIAQAFYGSIPRNIIDEVSKRIPERFKQIVEQFDRTYNIQY
jgi:ADP-ribosyl-[dinitrogen reductase] hydrolase